MAFDSEMLLLGEPHRPAIRLAVAVPCRPADAVGFSGFIGCGGLAEK
jgi:hypothetical protein